MTSCAAPRNNTNKKSRAHLLSPLFYSYTDRFSKKNVEDKPKGKKTRCGVIANLAESTPTTHRVLVLNANQFFRQFNISDVRNR
jgi:hypothetical protein